MAARLIDVYIKLPSGKTTTIDLPPSTKVARLYKHVAEDAGVDVGQIQLKYTGKILKKKHSLEYLGVCRETILKAEIIPLKRINIYIKRTSGETIPLSINNTSRVQEIKNQLEVKTEIEPTKQILKLSGAVLQDDNETAIEAGIQDEALLTLEVKTETTKTTTEESANENQSDEEIDEADREAVLSTFDAAGRTVEVVFSFDTTGSMYSVLAQVRTKLKDTVTRLLRDVPNIRIGIMAHGDYCDYDNYVLRSAELTSNVETLVNFVESVPSTGGGDSPECYEWVLKKAQQLDWAEDSAKALVVIGDCEPHPPSYTDQNINWHNELELLAGMGVKVYGVQAYENWKVDNFYKELADRTGGAYIKFKQFDIITDMFLAVCYTQSSPEQLQAFCEEVESEGRMTEEAKAMFTQLEEAKEKEECTGSADAEVSTRNVERYVVATWWDISKDDGSPKYSYDAQTDTWGICPSSSSSQTETKSRSWSLRESFRKLFRKK